LVIDFVILSCLIIKVLLYTLLIKKNIG